jgi:kynurenine formamidase
MFEKYRVIDLSLQFYEGMFTYPSDLHVRTELTIMGRHFLEGRMATKITIGSHAGTHADAPLHQIAGGDPIDKIPIDKFVGWAQIINLTDKKAKQPITAKDLDKRGKGVQKGDIVVFHTNWTQNTWDTKDFYANSNPWPTDDAVQWLLDHEIKCLITDCDVEDIKITTKPGPHHVALLGRGIPLVEYPVNLDQLTKDRVFICAAPINIRGCDGAPVRIVAIEEI